MGVKIRVRGAGKYFYLDIHYRGTRKLESLGFSLPGDKAGQKEAWRLAEEIRTKRELQLASGRFQLLDPVASRKTITKYAEEIAAQYDKKMHLPKSLKYLKAYAGEIYVGDVDEIFVDGYRAFLLSQEALGPATASHYLDALKALLSRAVRERLIDHNPSKGTKKIRIPKKAKPYLTIKEIQQMADAQTEGGELSVQCKKGFLLTCFTGLRLSDIKNLCYGNIRRDPVPAIVKQQNKTGELVSIPLCPTAWKLIDDRRIHPEWMINPRPDELVFPRLTASKAVNVHQPLIALRKKAGIDHAFGWHAGRHSFAMMTLEASGDLYAVSRLLGHNNIQMTTVYLQLIDPRAREIMASLPEIELDRKVEIIKMPMRAEGINA